MSMTVFQIGPVSRPLCRSLMTAAKPIFDSVILRGALWSVTKRQTYSSKSIPP